MGISRAGPLAYVVLAFFMFAVSIVTFIFLVLSFWMPPDGTLYENNQDAIWWRVDKTLVDRRLQVGGWVFVLVYEMLALGFAMACAYRHGAVAGSIRGSLSPHVQGLVILAHGGLVAWLLVMDRAQPLRYALIALGLAALCWHAALLLFHGTFETINADIHGLSDCDYMSAHVFINVGLGFVTSWATCMVFNQVSYILLDNTSLSLEHIVYIIISIIAFYACVTFIMDIFYFKKRTMYLYSPYVSCIATLAGIIWRVSVLELDDLAWILTLVVLGVVILIVVLKSVAMCVAVHRHSAQSKRGSAHNGHLAAGEFTHSTRF